MRAVRRVVRQRLELLVVVIRRHRVLRVLLQVDLDQVASLAQQRGAVGGEVSKRHHLAAVSKLIRDVVDRDQGATVPHLRRGEVENHAIVSLHPRVELLEEGAHRSEEERARYLVHRPVLDRVRLDRDGGFPRLDSLRTLVRVPQGTQHHPREHRHGEVGDDGDPGDQHQHRGVRLWYLSDPRERGPIEDVQDQTEHRTGERGDRHALDEPRAERDVRRDGHRARQTGDPSATPGLNVDHRLADHRAPAHGAEESVHQVRGALRDALLVGAGATLGDVVDELLGQQRLDQSNRRDGRGEWENRSPRLEGDGNVRDVKGRKGARDRRDVPDGLCRDTRDLNEGPDGRDGQQRRGYLLGDEGQVGYELDQRHRQSRERDLRVQRRVGETREGVDLRGADDDGEAVDEPDHARLRHESDELSQAQRAGDGLDGSGERDGGEEVLGSVRRDERGEDHGGGSRGAGDDAGLRAEYRGAQAHERRGV